MQTKISYSMLPLHPIIPVFILFLFGQLCGSILINLLEWLPLLILLILAALIFRRKYQNSLLLSLALGILSMHISDDFVHIESKKMAQVFGRVHSQPKRAKPNSVKFTLQVLDTQGATRDDSSNLLKGKLLSCSAPELPWRNLSGVGLGDYLSIVANIRANPVSRNPFSYSAKLRREGIVGTCKVIFASRKESQTTRALIFGPLLTKILSFSRLDPDRSLLISMAFGFGDQITESLEREFKATGLSHLLVFSGAQVVMFFIAAKYLFLFLRRIFYTTSGIFISPRIDDYFAIILSTAFVALVGFGQTGLRALVALLLSVTGRLLESELTFGELICVTAFLMSVIFPGCMLEPSMQLTFAALMGIWAGMRAKFGMIGTMILTSLSTSAISILWFGTFSIVGFLLNPLLVPAVSIVSLVGGGIILFTINLSDKVRDFLLYPITSALNYFEAIVHWASLRDWATFTVMGPKAYSTALVFLATVIVASFRPHLGDIGIKYNE